MREALVRAPWWVLSLVTGAVFGIAQLVVRLLQGDQVGRAAVLALVMGVLFGAVMGPFTRRLNRRYLGRVGALPAARQREVRRAAVRGPVPADPDERRAAAGLVADQLAGFHALRWAVAVYAVFAALGMALAATDGLWWLLTVALFVGLVAWQLGWVRHLRHRRDLLADTTTVD